MQRLTVRAERGAALLERGPERAEHLLQQPRVVTVVLVAADDAGRAADCVTSPRVRWMHSRWRRQWLADSRLWPRVWLCCRRALDRPDGARRRGSSGRTTSSFDVRQL
jgi:hypothetical protein